MTRGRLKQSLRGVCICGYLSDNAMLLGIHRKNCPTWQVFEERWDQLCLCGCGMLTEFLCTVIPGHQGQLISRSESIRKRIGLPNIGRKGTFTGKKHTPEAKEKMSQTHKGCIPWMKGKKHTKESRQKMSNALVGRISPMKGKIFSKARRQQMSEITTQLIKEGRVTKPNKARKFISLKNNKIITCRSDLEFNILLILEWLPSVISFIYEPFSILYTFKDQTKRYTPDILVTNQNSTKTLVEVKPSVNINNLQNQAKFKAAKEYCKQNNLEFEIWTENKLCVPSA